MSQCSYSQNDVWFGVIAVQLRLVSRSQLRRAVVEGIGTGQSIGALLESQGAIDQAARVAVETLVRRRAQHPQPESDEIASLESEISTYFDVEHPTPPETWPRYDLDGPVPYDGQSTLSSHSQFQIVELHARGGIGEVYRAREVHVGREVALKKIRSEYLEHEEARARFVREAEITARLQHPNIAPVYDVGADEDDAPFYAMRLLVGDSLNDRLKSIDALPSKRRFQEAKDLLRPLLDVCNAVSYAHSEQVIHRDIKPSNIVLGDFGETWLVDWGLARCADSTADVSNSTTLNLGIETKAGAVFGTPEFMSPEQATGRHDEVGEASDVYCLGGTLYAILTGTRPREMPSDVGSLAESWMRVALRPPVPVRDVSPQVPAPLAAVCQKAMEDSPGDRYASVAEFAADLKAWTNNEPVTAYEESILERSERILRRHRTVVTAALISLFGISVVSTAAFLSTNHSRTVAQQSAERARGVLEIVTDSFKKIDPHQGGDAGLLASDVLANARVAMDSSDLDEEGRAMLLSALAASLRGTGKLSEAVATAREALQLRLQRFGPEHPETLAAMHALAIYCGVGGQHEEAVELNEQVLAIRRKRLGPTHRDTLSSMANLGVECQQTARHDESIGILEEVLTLMEAKLGPMDRLTLNTMHNLANTYQQHDRPEEAIELYEKVIPLRTSVLGADHPKTLWSMNNLAVAYDVVDRHEEARALNEELLRRRTQKLGSAHPDTLFSIVNLAASKRRSGHAVDAAAELEEVLPEVRSTVGERHPATMATMHQLIKAYLACERYSDAALLSEEVVELRRVVLGTDHRDTIHSLFTLAEACREAGQIENAIEAAEEVARLLPPDHPRAMKAAKIVEEMRTLGSK